MSCTVFQSNITECNITEFLVKRKNSRCHFFKLNSSMISHPIRSRSKDIWQFHLMKNEYEYMIPSQDIQGSSSFISSLPVYATDINIFHKCPL